MYILLTEDRDHVLITARLPRRWKAKIVVTVVGLPIVAILQQILPHFLK